MNVTNCRGCGRLFNQLSNEQLCPNCMEKCKKETPELKDTGDGHQVACFLYE